MTYWCMLQASGGPVQPLGGVQHYLPGWSAPPPLPGPCHQCCGGAHRPNQGGCSNGLVPQNIRELQSFLGLASYYQRFVIDFASITSPLHRQEFQLDLLSSRVLCSIILTQTDPSLWTLMAAPKASEWSCPRKESTVSRSSPTAAAPQPSREKLLCQPLRAAGTHHRTLPLPALPLWGEVPPEHRSHIPYLSFKEPNGQLAWWLEAQQDYDFQIVHQAVRLPDNAPAEGLLPLPAC